MSLNIDILSCIVFWLTPYQAGQLSVTCRKTYEVATKRALSKLSLNKHPDQVREVYEATYSKALYRLLWLDELSLECWVLYPGYPNDEEESAASQVVQLLEGARNLKRLRISFFEHLIKKEPSVVYAISSLQRLSHITLFGIGPQALQLLSTLQSSPRGLELYFTKKPPEPLDLTDTLQYFSRFRTLAALSLGSMLFHIKDNCHLRLPSVLDLSVGRLLGPLSFLPDIFPHVRALTIYAAVPSIAPTVTLHPTLTHWSALDKICGNFSVLHKPIILAGPHIRRVEISEKDPCRDEGRLFLDIIKATSPVVLHTKLNRSLGTSFYQDLVRLAPNLTHLSLHVIYPLLGFRCAWWLVSPVDSCSAFVTDDQL